MKQPTYDQLIEEINRLKARVELYRSLIDNHPDLLYRTDLEGRVTYSTPSTYPLTGYTVEEAHGINIAEDVYLYPEERMDFLTKLQEAGHVNNFQAKLIRKDGSIWWASTNAHFVKDKAGKVTGVEGITRDISELKTAEEALRKSEERFRLAFHTSPDSITLSRAADGMIIDINKGFTKILGYSRKEVIGKTSIDLNLWKNPDDRKRLVASLSNLGFVENLESDFVGKDGNIITGLLSARFMKIDEEDILLLITRDITERKKLEQQLHQAQKFQALGTLAGGIAHNFNNLLMGIQGHASLIGSDFGFDPGLREHIKGIEHCVRSAAYLTKQLLGMARGGKYEIKAIDINELLLNSVNIFGRTRKEIEIHTKLHSDQLVVNADKNQIEQVLLNLLVNAWQAMPDGGKLYLDTSVTTLDKEYCQSHQIAPGRYCTICITDTGIGMDEETRRSVFDPFFTTKEVDSSTGLGLSSAYGIVKNHDGMIDVDSEVDAGTTFKIYLPLSSEVVAKEIKSEEKPIKGLETILLVDDEATILKVTKPMLEKLGYHVLLSENGQKAVDMVTQQGEAIDLVILDLIMPGMDGAKAYDHIRSLRPDMPVILSSGYALSGQTADIIEKGCNGFIQKPFDMASLSQKVREVLDGEQKNGSPPA